MTKSDSIWPRMRPIFNQTKDGVEVYRCLRWCGKVLTNYWYSFEGIQTDETMLTDFDIRNALKLDDKDGMNISLIHKRIKAITAAELKDALLSSFQDSLWKY